MGHLHKFRKLSCDTPLARLLSQHENSTQSGFVTRVDRSPVFTKRITFLKALALNTLILIFVTTLATMTIHRDLFSSIPDSLRAALCVTQDLLILWAIIVVMHSTTVPFFQECRLRSCYGFKQSEIVIRRLPNATSPSEQRLSEEQRFERYWRIATRAINPKLLYSNPGAILSNDYWVMDYSIVLDAYKSISRGDTIEEDYEFSLWKQEEGIWIACEFWRMQDIMSDQEEVGWFKSLAVKGDESLLKVWKSTSTGTIAGVADARCELPLQYYQ